MLCATCHAAFAWKRADESLFPVDAMQLNGGGPPQVLDAAADVAAALAAAGGGEAGNNARADADGCTAALASLPHE